MRDSVEVSARSIAENSDFSEGTVSKILTMLNCPPLSFSRPTEDERASLLDEAETEHLSDGLRVVGSEDKTPWERGWGELLESIGDRRIDYATLKPQYFREANWVRLWGDYAYTHTPDFEYWLGNVYRALVFDKYLSDAARLIEFGCGTGLNILIANQLFPEKKIVGTDWTKEACGIVEKLASERPQLVQSQVFDMQAPDSEFELNSQDAVLTVHALEQLGSGCEKFFDFLSKKRPLRIVNLEPIEEFYSESRFDVVALKYHRKRNYLSRWVSMLHDKEEAGELRIVEAKRFGLGNQFHEAYSLVVWEFC